MKLRVICIMAFIGMMGCQGESEDLGQFRTTKLGVALEETDASLALNGGETDESVSVVSAELWCNDYLESELSFDAEQFVELFLNIENCSVKLTAFKIGESEYRIDQAYTDMEGVYYFNNEENGEIEDQRLVRAWKEIDSSSIFNGCQAEPCDFFSSSVRFQYSILGIEHVIFENDVSFNKLNVAAEEEPAPTCEDLEINFVEATNESGDTLNLEIDLIGCITTINSARELEFGIKAKSISNFQSWQESFQISDAKSILSSFPVTPEQDGDNYKIVLTLDQIKELLGNSVNNTHIPNTVTALLADFIVVVSNENGVSALVYGIDNRCSSSEEG